MAPVKHQYTEEQIAEVFKAAGSFAGFLEVIGQDSERLPWWDAAVSGLLEHRLADVMADPDQDIETFSLLYCLWHVFYKPYQRVLFLTGTQTACKEVAGRMLAVWAGLTATRPWLVPPLTHQNQSELRFEHGSDVLFRIASGNAGKGLSTTLTVFHDVLAWKPRVYDEVCYCLGYHRGFGTQMLITGRRKRLGFYPEHAHPFNSQWEMRGGAAIHVPSPKRFPAGSAAHTAD